MNTQEKTNELVKRATEYAVATEQYFALETKMRSMTSQKRIETAPDGSKFIPNVTEEEQIYQMQVIGRLIELKTLEKQRALNKLTSAALSFGELS